MPRIVQLGLGPIGCALARQVLRRSTLDLVGAVDTRPDLVGRDVGEVLHTGPLGFDVSDDLGSALDTLRPDLVLHATGSFLEEVSGQLESIVDRGVGIVSTCEELAYPFYRHPELAKQLDDRARRAGVALLGTGVNPGFVMDKLVVTLLAACVSVSSVRVVRVVDAATRRESFQRKIGAGIGPAEFTERSAGGRLGHIGLVESAHMLADAMGVPSRRDVDNTLVPVVAKRRVASDCLSVEVGQVAGIDQTVTVHAGGRERVRMALQMFLGAEQPRDAVSVEGSPPLELEVTSGVPGDEGTVAVVIQCAHLLTALAPGLRTMLDVPLRPGSVVRR